MNRSQQSLSLRLLILLTATVAIFLLLSNRVEAGVPALAPFPYRVVTGDSLWTIAARVNGNVDVRAVVSEIQDLNDLTGSTIRPGQVLLIPSP